MEPFQKRPKDFFHILRGAPRKPSPKADTGGDTMVFRRALIFGLLSAMAPLGCASTPPYNSVGDTDQDSGDGATNDTLLDDNWEKWNSSQDGDYSFNLKKMCFCGSEVTRPVHVVVEKGIPTSVIYVDDGSPAAAEIFERYNTMEKLFLLIREAMDTADQVKVTYDPQLGYPSDIDIDYIIMAIDDESSYDISAVEIL
jgi:hypothetical protein